MNEHMVEKQSGEYKHVPGTSMAEVLKDVAEEGTIVSALKALNFIGQIADALSVSHSNGIIHHALRPENIVVTNNKTPVLINWASAIHPQPNDSYADNHIEVLNYESPEQLEGETLTERSNVYSLGVILYELLAGHRPRLLTDSWDIFERTSSAKLVPLEKVRTGLTVETYRLVKDCLWQQEWNRFETVKQMITAIDAAILAEQAAGEKVIKPAVRRQWVYGAASLIVFLLALGFFLLRGRSDNASQTAPPETAVPIHNNSTSNTSQQKEAELTTPQAQTPAPTIKVTVTRLHQDETKIELLTSPFVTGDTISFNWSYPIPLETDQHFAVYLISGDEASLIGSVSKPTNGSTYSLQVKGSEVAPMSGPYNWKVLLEASSGKSLIESPLRSIIIIPHTPTPSRTSTATSVPTPTAAETATPTPVCVPDPPNNWATYTVKANDYLFPLATQGGVTVDKIKRVNCLTDDVLSIGQILWLPSLPVTAVPATTDTATSPPSSGQPSTGPKPTNPPPPQATPTAPSLP